MIGSIDREKLLQALEDFDTSDPNRLNNIILISDGIETCAGDPCRTVEFAKRQAST